MNATPNTKQTAHTPTPWAIGTDTSRGAQPGRTHILADGAPWVSVAVANGAETDGLNERNAAFIVRACNSFDDLVAALRSLDALLISEWFPSESPARTTIRAALAKAGI